MGRIGSFFRQRDLGLRGWITLVASAGLVLALAVLTVTVWLPGGASHSGHINSPAFGDRADNRHDANPDVHHDANRVEGKDGGEPRSGGPDDPASAFVAERAFPRNYVDDARATAERHAFDSVPRTPPRSSFTNARAARIAAARPAASWSALGPTTPNVSAPASQFFDPNSLTGPTTQESGRVTALAMGPTCVAGDCKLWVAAAGGGVWRTDDALASPVLWTPPSDSLPTNAIGSLYYDATNNVLYAGSGEPNGSSDSEAGLGLFRSTDGGASWTQVPGSASIATNRSIGAITVDDTTSPATVYIGTDVARHGLSSVTSGRRTPPNAPALGVYRSIDGGQTFSRESDLASKTPPSPNPPAGGSDWFQGGINKLELDPNNHHMLYAGVVGYGIWRADESTGAPRTWSQVFHTMNQNNFSNPSNPGDTGGDRTEFDLVDRTGTTGIYVGDASDDLATASTPTLPRAWRNDTIAAVAGDATGAYTNPAGDGWVELSSSHEPDTGFGVYGFCQNGQCGYDEFVASPPGQPNTVWFGGSMNYNELPAYDQNGLGSAPISNGRAVVRSTNADSGTAATASTSAVTWQDMTAVLSNRSAAWGVQAGIHPDLHAIAFDPSGNHAFIGGDGGLVRLDTSTANDQSASCSQRTWQYSGAGTTPTALTTNDLAECQMLLSSVPHAITPLNDGLADLQFQSVSADPASPTSDFLGGTQDNGTWSFTGAPAGTEVVGGDGGQSGFDLGNSQVRFHEYFSATPEVNFHGGDPNQWTDIYDVLAASGERQAFYSALITDPVTAGRAFIGLQHVWRTDDDGGSQSSLAACNDLNYTATTPCGDWKPLGADLTGSAFGTDRSGDYVAAIARAPSDAETMWAATKDGRVFVSPNAGDAPGTVSFYRVDTPSTPGRFVSGIVVDPANPDHAWVSYSGYNAYTPATPGHVFEVSYDPSTHQASWTDRSYDLGDQPITAIAENDQTGDLYAATDFGVLRLAAGSSTWADAAGGMPHVAVYGLTYSPAAHTLYAASHGRGVYSLPVAYRPTGTLSGPASLTVGQSAVYSATGSSWDGSPISFAWTLPGSTSTTTGSNTFFTPSTPGLQTVTVVLTDGNGLSTTLSRMVNVAPAPPAPPVTPGNPGNPGGGNTPSGLPSGPPPRVSLGPIRTVRVGHPSVISGRITDPVGIMSATIYFGDGRHSSVRVGSNGRFRISHRYKLRRRASKGHTFPIVLVAVDRGARATTRFAHARVVRKPARRRPKRTVVIRATLLSAELML